MTCKQSRAMDDVGGRRFGEGQDMRYFLFLSLLATSLYALFTGPRNIDYALSGGVVEEHVVNSDAPGNQFELSPVRSPASEDFEQRF